MKYLEEIQDQKVAYYYSLPFGQNGLPKTRFKKYFYGGKFEIPVGFSMGSPILDPWPAHIIN